MLLKNKWVTKLIEEEVLKNMELNEKEDQLKELVFEKLKKKNR